MSITKMKVVVMNIEDKSVVFFDESAIGGAKGVLQAHYGKKEEVVLVNLDPIEEKDYDLPSDRFLLSNPKLSLRKYLLSNYSENYRDENSYILDTIKSFIKEGTHLSLDESYMESSKCQ